MQKITYVIVLLQLIVLGLSGCNKESQISNSQDLVATNAVVNEAEPVVAAEPSSNREAEVNAADNKGAADVAVNSVESTAESAESQPASEDSSLTADKNNASAEKLDKWIMHSWQKDDDLYTFNEDGTGSYSHKNKQREFTFKTQVTSDGRTVYITFNDNGETVQYGYKPVKDSMLDITFEDGKTVLYSRPPRKRHRDKN